MNKPRVSVIDDDLSVREAIESLLRSAGYEVEIFATAEKFFVHAKTAPPDCIILDVEMPGPSGLELQQELNAAGLSIPIIFLTGRGSIPMSVSAMKAGAAEFFTKPPDTEELLAAIGRIVRGEPAEISSTVEGSSDIIGASKALRSSLRRIELVAPTDSTVLILGETGTGKELLAREIHHHSRRSEKPLVRINCASIPKDLFESELFGHVRGAFTSAIRDRIGRFEAAEGGTLFLDEVGEVPLEQQSKLLRALQEKEYERVGDDRTRHADVRIVAATNRDLQALVNAGRFRPDLYYRLNIFPIEIAPLRERSEDIPLLAEYFVEVVSREMKCRRPRLTPAGLASLQAYHWPGNIRELRNVIERAVIIARGGALVFDLPVTAVAREPFNQKLRENNSQPLTESELLQRNRENLLSALEQTGWKIKGANGAAELLGIKPTTLISRIKKLGLERDGRV
jgi:DNA-binding NtrC family response regulator